MQELLTHRPMRVLALVDEGNLLGAARMFNRRLDWSVIPGYFASEEDGRQLVEMVAYIGLPPDLADFREARERKLGFVRAIRNLGILVVTKEGAPRDLEGNGGPRFKANVDVVMAIDAMALVTDIRPDVVVLVTGDADFAHLALTLRRRGIRVEVAALEQNLGSALREAANGVIDLRDLFNRFDPLRGEDHGRIGGADVFDE